jgi:hypothetical protein
MASYSADVVGDAALVPARQGRSSSLTLGPPCQVAGRRRADNSTLVTSQAILRWGGGSPVKQRWVSVKGRGSFSKTRNDQDKKYRNKKGQWFVSRVIRDLPGTTRDQVTSRGLTLPPRLRP